MEKRRKDLLEDIKSVLNSLGSKDIFTVNQIAQEFSNSWSENINFAQLGYESLMDLLMTDESFTKINPYTVRYVPATKVAHINDLVRNQRSSSRGRRGKVIRGARNSTSFGAVRNPYGPGPSYSLNPTPTRTLPSQPPVSHNVQRTPYLPPDSARPERIMLLDFERVINDFNHRSSRNCLSPIEYFQALCSSIDSSLLREMNKYFAEDYMKFAEFVVDCSRNPNARIVTGRLQIGEEEQGSSSARKPESVTTYEALEHFPFTTAFRELNMQTPQEIDVEILDFQSPSLLYIARCSDEVQSDDPSVPCDEVLTNDKVYAGMPCLWPFECRLRRAVVTKVEGSQLSLFLVDMGIAFTKIEVQDLKPISEELRREPLKVLCCRLYGIQIKDSFSKYTIRKMRKRLSERTSSKVVLKFRDEVNSKYAIDIPDFVEEFINSDQIERFEEQPSLNTAVASLDESSLSPQNHELDDTNITISEPSDIFVEVVILKNTSELWLVKYDDGFFVPTGCIASMLLHKEDKILPLLDEISLIVKNIKHDPSESLRRKLESLQYRLFPISLPICLVPIVVVAPILKILTGEMIAAEKTLAQIEEIALRYK